MQYSRSVEATRSYLQGELTEPKQPHQAHSFKKAAIRVSNDTLILGVTHLLSSTDARPLRFKRQEV